VARSLSGEYSNIRARKKSLQIHMNCRTAAEATAGSDMGMTICKKTLRSEAPSTLAASSTSTGTVVT
jgi:hypothetical protein